MNCTTCGRPTAVDAHFCAACGQPVAAPPVCPGCGLPYQPQHRFCAACGTRLSAGDAAPPLPPLEPRSYMPRHLAEVIMRSRSALEGERKLVTILFADVKGSMDLASALELDEWHQVMNRFFAILSGGIYRFEGTVTQYAGDGLMALFGAPIAHEDHAQRACYAALHLREQLKRYADELRLRGVEFSVRIGINSGEVVVGRIGDDLHVDYTAHGHAVGLAARMEQAAEPDSIYLTEATALLVHDYVELRPLGALPLKGITDPLPVFELLGPGRMRTRLDVSRTRGFAPFVGRARELRLLEEALDEALGGSGQVVEVRGEAGVGKSRLCHEFAVSCRDRGIVVHRAHAPAHGATVPFLLILQLLREMVGITEQHGDEEARQIVTDRLLGLDDGFQLHLPALIEFLGVAAPEATLALDPEAKQQRLFDFVRRFVRARSAREPTLIVLDDLQWADRASEAFLAHLVDAVRDTRTLVVGNTRPDYVAGWLQRTAYRSVSLQPLRSEYARELLGKLLGTDLTLAGVAEAVVARTGGNAFFIEEVVRALVEAGVLEGSPGRYRLAGPMAELEIPDSVRIVLNARIDRLAERDRIVLQTAAVIGKRVPEAVLRQVVELPEPALAESLDRLTAADFLVVTALLPDAEYAFRHPLTQEVAYRSQLAARRASLHGAVGRAIEACGRAATEPFEVLAYHFSRSADRPRAVHYLELAGDKAAGSFSLQAARAQYRAAVELIDSLPAGGERDGQRIDVTLKWAEAGLLGPEPEQLDALRIALEMAIGLRDPTRTARCVYWMGWNQYALGNQVEALEHTERCVAMAQAARDDRLVAQLHLILASIHAARGEYPMALHRVRTGIDLRAECAGGQPTVGIAYGLGTRALTHADMGRFADAHRDLDDAGAMLEALGRRSVTGSLASIRGMVCSFRGDWDGARGPIGVCHEIGDLIGAPLLHGIAGTLEGAARFHADGDAGGLEVMRQAVEFLERSGVLLTISWNYACLAEAHALAGDVDAARAMAGRALAREAVKDRLGASAAERALAVAAAHAGEPRAARAHAAAARRLAEAKGSRREVALVDLRAGGALLSIHPSPTARASVARAASVFAELDMPWYEQQARTLLEASGPVRRARAAGRR